jgi:serine/threonine protein kinase
MSNSKKQRLGLRHRSRISVSHPTLPKSNILNKSQILTRSAPELHAIKSFYYDGAPLEIKSEVAQGSFSIVYKVTSPKSSPNSSPNSSLNSSPKSSPGVSPGGSPTPTRKSKTTLQICEITDFDSDVDDIVYSEKSEESENSILKACTDNGTWESKKDYNAEKSVLLNIPLHENIVRCFGPVMNTPVQSAQNGNIGFLLEYCQNGNLQIFLKDMTRDITGRPQDQTFIIRMIKDIIRPITHLHKHNLIHRDIRSLNYLVTSDRRIKLCDFGLCRKNTSFNKETTFRRVRTNPVWTAPELYDCDIDQESDETSIYTFKSDVYSLAIVMWEILNVWFNKEYRLPFDVSNIYRVMVTIVKGERPSLVNFSDEWKDLLSTAWNADVDKRPTSDELLEMVKTF